MRKLRLLTSTIFVAVAACGPTGADDLAIDAQSLSAAEERAVLAFVNAFDTSFGLLDEEVGLDRRAAQNIVDHRKGPDGRDGTADDDPFETIEELDAVPYVGPKALGQLLAFLRDLEGPPAEEAPRDELILAVANDGAVTFLILDEVVGLDKRAARGIVDFRAGPDGAENTADDRRFTTLEELDAVPYVGDRALEQLFAFAQANGYGAADPFAADVVFSPQPYASSHNKRVEGLIDGAVRSLDVAMYSFSDEAIFDAIERATARGVEVRFVFETANEDRKAAGEELAGSRSARLERMGVDVRYVNKIMHHKFVLVDGPRYDIADAPGARLATGSGNWSYGAATRYDENTLFLEGTPELALRFQAEFDHLWAHSRDFVFEAAKPHVLSASAIDSAAIEDGADAHAYFTSDNFTVSGDTFRVSTGRNRVSDAMVAAIQAAQRSIHIASGHMRSRPIAEALMRRAAEDPALDIRVYLDGQEHISAWYHAQQTRERDACIEDAGTSAAQLRSCLDRGFLYGYALGEAGIDVRYKVYSYRWHYTYAVQMHHKYMIIDGQELWTGSYNLSDNAEHNTFENVVVLKGARFADTVAAYEANFEAIWRTERDGGTYADLLTEVANDPVIPLVFTPMALTWQEVVDLEAAIRSNCDDIDTEPFRTRPEDHRVCYR